MILSKLYSSDPRFKTMEFNEGFNIIIGGVEKINKNDTHGLGKTTIVKLIDYMLLKGLKKGHFLKEHSEKFKNHIFFLEIKLNSGQYLTIKRGVEKNTKISFKRHKDGKQDLSKYNDWDEVDIAIRKAKTRLKKYLGFNVLIEHDYRKFLRYIIRAQGDYSKLFDTLYGEKDKNWKPQLLELFGINNKEYVDKIKLVEEKEEINKKYSNPSGDYIASLQEKEQYLMDLEVEIKNLKEQIDNFDYYEIDGEITKEVADDIYTQISNLNRVRFNLQVDIKKIKDKLNNVISDIDLENLEILFEEVGIYFKDSLKKDYNDLINFNKQISKERKEHFKKSLTQKEKELEKLEESLLELNIRQSEVLKILSRNDEIKKIIDHQKEYNNLEIKKGKLETEIDFLSEGRNQLKKIEKLDIEIAREDLKIKTRLENKSDIQNKIVSLLIDLSTKIFYNLRASLTIGINGAGNLQFSLKLRDKKTDEITSEDDGNHKKIYMISAFDIALIVAYLDKSYYRFIFHDGNIEATDHRLKRAYLKTVKEYCNEHSFQYITTAIEDEIKDVEDLIEESDVALRLTDDEDHSGTVFGFNF